VDDWAAMSCTDTPGSAEIHGPKVIVQSPLVTLRVLLVPALVLFGIYCFHFRFYQNYFPFGDDPALLNASEGNPAKWFTEGYSKYFVVYPEWNVPRTDFLRPVVNLIVRLNHVFFGDHYVFYFATFYFAQFLVCALVFCLAAHLGVNERWLYSIGLLAAINPAFVGEGLYSASFHFDIWCGLFTVFALYLILRERYGLAVLSLTFAVFTKESALYAPVAAAVTVYLITRRRLLAVTMLLPLVAWACVWKLVFIGTPAGNYALQGDPKALLIKGSIQGFLRWPTGIFDYHVVRQLLVEHSIIAHLPDLVVLLINLVLWGFLIALGAHFARAVFATRSLSDEDRLVLAVLIWLAGALSFGVLVGYHSRFGGSIYPLEIVICAVIFQRSRHSLARPFAAVAIGSLAAAFLWNAQTMDPSDDGIVPYHHSSQISTMRSLVDALRRYRADVIYVLNSSRSDATPSSIASLAGAPFEKVIVLSEATGCVSDSRADPPIAQQVGEAVHIVSILPACASYEFNGVKPSILAQAFGGILPRDHLATYSLPGGRIVEHGLVDNTAIAAVDMGRELDLNLFPEKAKSYVILYYDWSGGRFMCAGAHCSSSPETTPKRDNLVTLP
jgi:hypothetical protein